jgi:hypothetical protein
MVVSLVRNIVTSSVTGCNIIYSCIPSKQHLFEPLSHDRIYFLLFLMNETRHIKYDAEGTECAKCTSLDLSRYGSWPGRKKIFDSITVVSTQSFTRVGTPETQDDRQDTAMEDTNSNTKLRKQQKRRLGLAFTTHYGER